MPRTATTLPFTNVSVTAALLVIAAACGKTTPASDHKRSANTETQPATGTPEKIRVTGIPDENPTELARQYQPLVNLLEANLGVPVEYVPLTDYGAAVQALAAGKVDFAWLGGFTHVQSRTLANVVPLVMRDIDREFHSVFVASSASGITKLSELKGKSFAFGSKSSTSGHIMPRYYLLNNYKIDPDHDFAGAPVFSGAHDATAKIVESGTVQAGVLNKQVWERMVADRKIDTTKVFLLWETPPYVDYVWTARAAIPEETREKFAQTFLELDSTNPQHKSVLDRMGANAYVKASPHDFDAIESVARATGMLK